jgi:hypothetical protein
MGQPLWSLLSYLLKQGASPAGIEAGHYCWAVSIKCHYNYR